ncbi:MAG TPA: flagellar biosynthesis protein FlhF [Desulfonatronum sp.]|nr:flagellar biosynthesis protein FlhF [Desulfonatronum sp.]
MQVKAFRGPNTRTVLNRIREELGPEAVILSTQNIRENGKSSCEVTAALESPANNGGSKNAAFPGWQAMHQEWSMIKEHMLSVLKPQADYALLTPRQRQSLEYLEREGMTAEVAMHLWRQMKNAPDISILEPLRGVVPTKPWQEGHWPGKIHALAGPHGVGKTSSLLRLALNMRKEHPTRRICLVNADQQHGKGRLLLQHYAELGGLPFFDVRTAEDWRELLCEAKRFDKIFIDFPGLSRETSLQTWLAEKEFELPKDACVHLVLNPHYATSCLKSFAKRFHVPSTASVIWTKLDEAESYGSMINLGYISRLPVSALCFGPCLSACLVAAKDQLLWKMIFTHRLPERKQEEDGR